MIVFQIAARSYNLAIGGGSPGYLLVAKTIGIIFFNNYGVADMCVTGRTFPTVTQIISVIGPIPTTAGTASEEVTVLHVIAGEEEKRLSDDLFAIA